MLEYGRHIQETLRLLQRGDVCGNCPEITKIDTQGKALEFDVLFRTVSFNMHRWMCNCKCVYCDLHKQRLPAYSILPAIESLHSQGLLHRNCFFSWGGGESTLLAEFEEAASLIHGYGFKQYIHTNALRYSDVIAALLAKGAMGVNISLDSGSPETYKSVKGVDGFKRVVASIGEYIAVSADKNNVVIKYIIFAANNSQAEIEKFFSLCQYMGIKNVEFSFDFREVNAGGLSKETLDAAILFVGLANALGIKCTPFFVDGKILAMMKEIATAD